MTMHKVVEACLSQRHISEMVGELTMTVKLRGATMRATSSTTRRKHRGSV